MNIVKTSIFIGIAIVYTVLVEYVDVKPIGPNESLVGFSYLNDHFHHLTGKNLLLYTITDWAGFVPIIIGIIYGFLGLIQWIKRKGITKVDKNILSLGIFYIITFLVYIIFEFVVINHRPILIDGYLEASYPSSTTMLAICFMTTSVFQTNKYFKNEKVKKILFFIQMFFLAFMVIGRTISGVHWLTDIIGGILFSIALIGIYCCINRAFKKNSI